MSSNTERKSGFYWVKGTGSHAEWTIGEYHNGIWYLAGNQFRLYNESFSEIDER